MRTYGSVKAISAPRTGSIAKKPTSAPPSATVSTDFAAAFTTTHSKAVPRRRASSRAMSTDTPYGPVVLLTPARMGLPTLIVARSVPVGASAARMESVDIDGSVTLVMHDVVIALPATEEDRRRQSHHGIMHVADEGFHQ